MLKNNVRYLNYKNTHQLPHMLKINLHTKLDDGKDPNSRIDDKTKNELKEKIKNEIKDKIKEEIEGKLKKDLKCEIGDKTKNELKEKIKNEIKDKIKEEIEGKLKKDLKCEIGDKTKNELKEKIKNELEKDLKCEIDDKTKNELKEKIKNELEKDLKCEIDDKTKNELKEKIKNEIKDKIKKEIEDEIDCKKNGKKKGGDDDENGKKKGGDDDENSKKKGDDDDENGKKKGGDDDGNEVEETVSIVSKEITQDHADATKCGSFGGYYNTYNQVGRHGFSTSELLEAFYPEMYNNPKIAEHLKMGSKVFYGAVNYKFAFSEPFDYSWGNVSNMWCKKCSNNLGEIACQGDEIKSFCYPAGIYMNQGYNESFFAERTCPNLVKVSGSATIKVKQVAPLILVDSSGKMIDKEGNNTQMAYSSLSPYLKANGHIKDCAGDAKCKSFAEIMKKVAWDTNKEVLLKTVSGDLQEANPYYYDNEDNSVSVDTNFV